MQQAVAELKELILQHYPEATFQVTRSPENPATVLLKPVVDVEDRDEVMDVVIERLGALQSEAHVPLFVLPIHPPERVAQTMRQIRRQRRAEALLPHASPVSP